MDNIARLVSLGLGVALLGVVFDAAAVCGGVTTSADYEAEHRGNEVCLPANAQAGNHLTYSSIGETYNNTSSTTQAICNMPGIANRPIATLAAIVEKVNHGENDQPTNCTLRAYDSWESVVYSDSLPATKCAVGLQITPAGVTSFGGANVRCYLSPKVGSSVASIASVREAYWED